MNAFPARLDPQARAVLAQFDKRAELLTKQWLMGVRRGFLSLIPKTVSGFNEALRAIGKLQRFMGNLEDQVTLIRKGAYTWGEGYDEGRLFRKKLKLVNDSLYAAETAAGYWKNMSEGKGLGGGVISDWDRQAIEQTLTLYSRNFVEVFEHHIPTKGRGPKGTRRAGLVEVFDGMLKVLYADVKALETENFSELTRKNVLEIETPRIRSIGNMTFVVVAKFKSALDTQRYFKEAHKAYEKIRSRGLDKGCWYGVTFVMAEEPLKLTDEEKAEYKHAGYDIEYKGGDYSTRGNDIRLWTGLDRLQSTLIHEIGHRYWFKHMKQEERMQFIRSVWTKDKAEIARSEGRVPRLDRAEAKKQLDDAYENAWRQLVQGVGELPENIDKIKQWYDAHTWGASMFYQPFDSFYGRMQEPFAIIRRLAPRGLADQIKNQPALKAFWDFRDKAVDEFYKEVSDAVKQLEARVQPKGQRDTDVLTDEARLALDKLLKDFAGEAWSMMLKIGGLLPVAVAGLLDALYANEDEIKRRQVKPVSDYGETNADEAFAEVFADYVMGVPMTREQAQSFISVMKGMRKQAATVVTRFEYDAWGLLGHGSIVNQAVR
jgi:hypothetical protein